MSVPTTIVLDGGKPLRAAVKALWGNSVIIQRCWLHKLRNIRDYLPEANHGQLYSRMKKIMGLTNHDTAKAEVESLAKWLSEISPDAEASLREAAGELLTVHSLGVTGEFRKSLSSTNIIESLIGVTKVKMNHVREYHPKTGKNVPRDKVFRWVSNHAQAHRPRPQRVRGERSRCKLWTIN